MKYKIEKNIPISAHGHNRSGHWTKIIKEMEVGDSVVVKDRKKANSITLSIKRLGYKPITRKVDNGIRVWKMENKNANE